MSNRLAGVLAALPALLLLWYLPALGGLYWWRAQTRYGASGSLDGGPSEAAALLNPPDWTAHAAITLVLAAVVLGIALAGTARRPAFGVLVGLPLTAAGVYGMLSAQNARDLTGALKVLSLAGGPDVSAGQLRAGTATYLGQGLCLLVGGTLLAAALWAQHPPRERRRALPAAGAGLLAMLAAWGCLFEAGARGTGPWLVLTCVAAFLLGWTAGSGHLPAVAPLVCGLPALVLGLGDVLGRDFLLEIADTVLPLSPDSGEHVLLLRGSVLASTVPLLILGGALVVAAAGALGAPGHRTSRGAGKGRAARRPQRAAGRNRGRRPQSRPSARARARS
ncbi:hypothetical protein [Actinocorallia populi]|uniref:hypothetical protein n=1 Tax=Actinocorallia populi TaxID=2079200 RepID=UPI000D08987F|nr:hypothetical protein [Actinocorallia populi]